MSGYRTLHRIEPSKHDESSFPPPPIWRVRFSPCRSPPSDRSAHRAAPSTQTPPATLRLLAAGASDGIRCYSLAERTEKDASTDDVLDASAMSVEATEILVSKESCPVISDNGNDDDDDEAVRQRATTTTPSLGYAALDVVRNYCGADASAGNEIVASSQLGGRVCVWVRLDPVSIEKGTTMADDDAPTIITTPPGDDDDDGDDGTRYIQPHAEFAVDSATGTTIALRPPSLANHYSKRDTDVLVALGCADGSVVLCKTGVLAARPGGGGGGGDNGATTAGSSSGSAVVGDSSSSAGGTVKILSGSVPGEVVATVGGGHACVMSLAFHPTVPNAFVAGRKDGTVDIYSSAASDDYYRGGGGGEPLSFRRMHRLVHSSFPVRALSFSRPDGALLFAGDDDGKLYSYDASCNNERTGMSAPVRLVACAIAAHRGWVMHLAPFPDGRRVATCGSDGSVRVWDCGMGLASGTPVHSFEGAHGGLAWGVDCGNVVGASGGGFGGGGGRARGDRLKLISCGNDGVMQVFSCDE